MTMINLSTIKKHTFVVEKESVDASLERESFKRVIFKYLRYYQPVII